MQEEKSASRHYQHAFEIQTLCWKILWFVRFLLPFRCKYGVCEQKWIALRESWSSKRLVLLLLLRADLCDLGTASIFACSIHTNSIDIFAQQQNVATLFVDAIEKNREWNYWAANNICVCYIFWLWNANDRVSNWNNSYSQHNTKCISWSMKSQSQHLEIFVTTVNIVRLEIQTSKRKKKKRNMVIKLKRPLRQSAFLISIHWSNSHTIAIHSNTEAGRRRTESTRMRIYWYTRVCNRRHRRDTWYNCAHIDNRNGAQ